MLGNSVLPIPQIVWDSYAVLKQNPPKIESTLFIYFKFFFILIDDKRGEAMLTPWIEILCSEQ